MMGSIMDLYSNALTNAFGQGPSGSIYSLYGSGLKGAYPGGIGAALPLLSGLAGNAGSGLGDVGNWLHSLFGGTGQPFAGSNPFSSTAPAAGVPGQATPPPGSQMMTPTTYPAGSTMLTPGGTPATATPVGGTPAAPGFSDMGPNYLPAGMEGGGMTSDLSAKRAAAQGQANIDAMHQFVAQHMGLDQDAISATVAALQRAAAYRQYLLGG